MKRCFLFLLFLLASGSFVFAGAESESAEASGVNMSAPGILPIVEETVNLRVGAIPYRTVLDLNENYATRWLEEKTNVHIEWDVFPAKDAAAKINLLLASAKDLPDVFLGAGVLNSEQLLLYGSQGLFQPLNDYIDKYGFEVKRFFDEFPLIEKVATTPDGNIYALGNFDYCFHCYYSQKVWYNKTWLDALGLSVPETTEEFYEMLKAFKERDPNNNGKADEVPMSGATTGWNAQPDGFLMNPFIYNDGNNRLILENGKVSAAFTDPAWREGLRYMNRLYSEGLLDQEAFIQDANQMKQMVEGETVILGAAPAGVPAAFSLNEGEATKNFYPLAPLKGPTGLRQVPYNPPEHGFRNGRFAITKECENPEVAYRWADFMYNEETTLTLYFGEQDVDWAYAKPGDLGVDGSEALFDEITMVRGVPQQNQAWSHMSPRHASWGIIQGRTTDPDDIWYIEKRLYDATVEFYEPYGRDPERVMPPLFVDLDEVSDYNELRSNINSFVKEYIARFTTGDVSLDNDWDAYVAELDKIGLDKYLDIVQRAYDRTYK